MELDQRQFQALLTLIQADLPGRHEYLTYTLGDWKLRVLKSSDCPYAGLVTILTPPFPWTDELSELDVGGATVRVSFCMPANDEEVALLSKLGQSAFVERLDAVEVDVLDPLRASLTQ